MQKPFFTSVLFLVLGLSSIQFDAIAQQPVKQSGKSYLLQYKPKVGTKGTMLMEMRMDMTMNMMGQEMNMLQQLDMSSILKITDQSKSNTVSKMNYDYIKMAMENPMTGTMTYDSRNVDENNTFAANMHIAMKPVLDSSIIITQDRTGKVVNNGGEMGVVAPSSPQGSSTNLSTIMSMSQFPKEPVKVGDSWKGKQGDETSNMLVEMTYTLVEVVNNIVKIKVEGKISLNEDFIGEETMSSIDGIQDGVFIYDLDGMWLIEGELTQKMAMTVMQSGMEVPTKMINRITITVED